jgi:hypothetical protein
VGPKSEVLDTFRYELHSKWTIKELGNTEYFLGIRIIRDRENNKLYLCQDTYIDKILVHYSIINSKPIKTPIVSGTLELIVPFDGTILKKNIEEYGSIIGSLNYLVYQTHYNIIYIISVLSRFLTNPSPAYIKVAKRVFQYLKDIKYLSIIYGSNIDNNEIIKLYSYFDSDFASNLY